MFWYEQILRQEACVNISDPMPMAGIVGSCCGQEKVIRIEGGVHEGQLHLTCSEICAFSFYF